MKANFGFVNLSDYRRDPDSTANNHAEWLAVNNVRNGPGQVRTLRDNDYPPEKFKNYYFVDVSGKEFVWMNDSFPKDRYKWYLWYESVFLVPEEMATFLILRWS